MLRTETVTSATLELLTDLMNTERLTNFFLVGGTALSLQLGHRISVDLDLFSLTPFDENELSFFLETEKKFQLSYINKNTLKGTISGVQVDLITHAYPLVKNIMHDGDIRLANIHDIAAMKLNAIIGNGTRLKDFVDIAFLSGYISLDQMKEAYEQKYSSRNSIMILKALSYHADVNFNEPVRYLTGSYSWKTIEQRLSEMIKYPNKVFPLL